MSLKDKSIPDDITHARVTFYPQIWHHGRAVTSDDTETYLVPIEDALNADGELVADDTDASDSLARVDDAPDVAQNWTGPFYVTVDELVTHDTSEDDDRGIPLDDLPERICQWASDKTHGEQMVHRLRQWEAGQTLYGCESINPETGASMGKTFQTEEYNESGLAAARKAFDGAVNGPLSNETNLVVLFRATIHSIRTEGRDPQDPGEPPLKFAHFDNVVVLDYHLPSSQPAGDACA